MGDARSLFGKATAFLPLSGTAAIGIQSPRSLDSDSAASDLNTGPLTTDWARTIISCALGGGCWNVSSPQYSAPTSSATAASWGTTRRRLSELWPHIAS